MESWFRRAAVLSLVLFGSPACSDNRGKVGAPAGGGATSSTEGASVGGTTGTGSTTGTGGSLLGGMSGSGGTQGGGTTGAGGATGMGGSPSSGGAFGTGGIRATGGATGSGGSTRMGGAPGTGGTTGATAAGGSSATGGVTGTGGASSNGGATRTGGSGTGGATGAGGSTGKSPYKGVANSPAGEIATLGATWCYNWGTAPKASDCADPYFVPMIWGKGDVAASIKALGNAGYKTVLGFNEPNKSDQANMTVDEAIALWPALTSDANIRVSSPAVSDDGRAWLESFMTEVKAQGLRVDFIAMHWYGWNAGSCVASQLEGAVNWASKWGLPVWITEFGCMGSSNPDEQTVLSFFNAAIPMLQKHALVERYAWYPWNTYNDLYLAGANQIRVITALGKAFAAAPSYRQ